MSPEAPRAEGSVLPSAQAAVKARRERPPVFAQILFGLLVLSTLRAGGGPANTSITDVAMLIIIAVYLAPNLLIVKPSAEVSHYLVGFLLVLSAYVVLQLLMLATVGGSGLVVVKDAFSPLFMVVACILLLPHLTKSDPRLARFAVVASAVILSVSLALDPRARAEGTFSNPNLAGAWAGCALVLLVAMRYPRRLVLRIPLILFVAAAISWTGSFAAMFAVALSLVYLAADRLALRPWAKGLLVVLSAGVAYSLITILDEAGALNRSERSLDSRVVRWLVGLDVWRGQPWGIGPGSYVANGTFERDGSELHSEFVQALVELGPIGLLLLIAMGVVLWRVGGICTRTVIVFMAAIAIWRDSLNFRFLWLMLGCAIAVDYWQARTEKAKADVDVDP
ncbi:MAG: hypothetical protein Q7V58_14995 [Actinomycetota bacterium]|nr:hypothetical protein [Actinomycetota bacterium]